MMLFLTGSILSLSGIVIVSLQRILFIDVLVVQFILFMCGSVDCGEASQGDLGATKWPDLASSPE